MATAMPRALIEIDYEEAAQAYLRSLPLEHFMEAPAQAKQREITLESLALLKARRPDVQVFNELLVQYPWLRQRRLGQVVPDNMVVVSNEPVRAVSSYNLTLEAARPFWVMEYVSKHSQRKDYKDSFNKYERDLKVPYYLIFNPDKLELTLYHHNGKKYVAVKPNKDGRYPLAELDLEIGLLGGWVRFWHQGELLLLPADLQRDLEDAQRRADELQHRLEAAERELARYRAAGKPPGRRNGSRGDK